MSNIKNLLIVTFSTLFITAYAADDFISHGEGRAAHPSAGGTHHMEQHHNLQNIHPNQGQNLNQGYHGNLGRTNINRNFEGNYYGSGGYSDQNPVYVVPEQDNVETYYQQQGYPIGH